MSKDNRKDKFFCIPNCLPVKSKAVKSHKNVSRRPFKDENDDVECESIADTCSVAAKMNHTRQWLQNLSTNVNYDEDSTLMEKEFQKSKSSSKGSSNEFKRNSLNDSTAKPRLDSTISSTGTVKEGGAIGNKNDSALPSVSKSNRRFRQSKRKLPDGDGLSMASSCVSLATEKITIKVDPKKSLGITIVGHTNGIQGDCGIFIGTVKTGGAADETGKVEPGDLIVEVNGVDLENLSNEDALAILKREMSKPGILTLVLAKYWDLDESHKDYSVENKYADVHEFGSIYGHGSREDTVPRNMPPLPSRLPDDLALRRRRYEESFDVYGSRMDYLGRPQSSLMTNPAYYHPHPPAYPPRPYYPHMPPTYMGQGYHDIRKHHVLPQYGFPPPPNVALQPRRPLLGSELVDWIQETVSGMTARNEARNYAQMLLDMEYISGTDKRFHEDGWFALIADRPLPFPLSF